MKRKKILLASVFAFVMLMVVCSYSVLAWNATDQQVVRRMFGSRALVKYEGGYAVELIYPNPNPPENPFSNIQAIYGRIDSGSFLHPIIKDILINEYFFNLNFKKKLQKEKKYFFFVKCSSYNGK